MKYVLPILFLLLVGCGVQGTQGPQGPKGNTGDGCTIENLDDADVFVCDDGTGYELPGPTPTPEPGVSPSPTPAPVDKCIEFTHCKNGKCKYRSICFVRH